MSTPHIAAKAAIAVEVEAGRNYWWCSCGLSQKQPFCDGSHKGGEFSPTQYTAEKTGQVWFCACKHSRRGALCDGTHKSL